MFLPVAIGYLVSCGYSLLPGPAELGAIIQMRCIIRAKRRASASTDLRRVLRYPDGARTVAYTSCGPSEPIETKQRTVDPATIRRPPADEGLSLTHGTKLLESCRIEQNGAVRRAPARRRGI
jgi:hypothetical protein